MCVGFSALLSFFAHDWHSQYYTRALGSSLGQRVRAFYTTTSKQIFDIHEEARRIADEHKASQQTHPTSHPSSGPPSGTHASDKEVSQRSP